MRDLEHRPNVMSSSKPSLLGSGSYKEGKTERL